MTNKLKFKLKRTAEEEAQHRLRKERRREKRKRKQDDYEFRGGGPSSSKRAHVDEDEGPQRKWASSDEDEGYQHGPQPASSSSSSHIPPSHAHKPDYDSMKAEIEENLFRAKMFDNLEDDERLDAVEARLNDFAHVPDRWQTPATGSGSGLGGRKERKNFHDEDNDDLLKLDPRNMDEEEYAEWIRAGMYRKTHAEEYAEQQRKKAAHAARRAEEKARKAEAARLEKAAEEERRQRKLEREERKLDYAREEYNMRWKLLASGDGQAQAQLSFDDVPWPVAAAHRSKPDRDKRRHKDVEERSHRPTSVEDLTAEAISSFLLPLDMVVGPVEVESGTEMDRAARKKERKDKLRETFLRFHPDKFEGRFMKRVREEERERVRDAIGQVSRVLNGLMGEGD